MAELKVGRGKTRPEQDVWLAELAAVAVAAGARTVGAYLWTPDSWDEIEEVLR